MAIICEKKEVTLNFKEGKPTMYRIAPIKQQQVPFDKLLDETSNACGIGRAQVKASVEALLDRMTMLMDFGMSVKLGDFGTFKPTISVKAQANAEDLSADNVRRRKIQFRPGKRFKTMLSNMSVTTRDDAGSQNKSSEEEGGDD